MPKLPEKSSDEILNEWKEAYKTEPNKYKEKLAGVVYSSWYYMVPKSEECQKYPLTCLCDFDVNRVIDEMVYGKKFSKEKIRFNFFKPDFIRFFCVFIISKYTISIPYII